MQSRYGVERSRAGTDQPPLYDRLFHALHSPSQLPGSPPIAIHYHAVAVPSPVRQVEFGFRTEKYEAVEVLRGLGIVTRFAAAAPGLSSLTLSFTNLGEKIRASAVVELVGPRGVVVRRKVTPQEVAETTSILLQFCPEPESFGEIYELRVTSEDGVQGDALRVLCGAISSPQVLACSYQALVACPQKQIDTDFEILIPIFSVLSNTPRYSTEAQGWENRSLAMIPAMLVSGRTIGARVRNELTTISEVQLLTATHVRINEATITLQIIEEEEHTDGLPANGIPGGLTGTVRLRKDYSARDVLDNAYTSFQFESIAVTPGKFYRIEFSSHDGSPGNSISIYSNCLPIDSEIYRKRIQNGKSSATNFRRRQGAVPHHRLFSEAVPARRPGDLAARKSRWQDLSTLRVGLVVSNHDRFTGRWKQLPLPQSLLRERVNIELFDAETLADHFVDLERCDTVIFADQSLFEPTLRRGDKFQLSPCFDQALKLLRFLGIPSVAYRTIRRDEIEPTPNADPAQQLFLTAEEKRLRAIADLFDLSVSDSAIQMRRSHVPVASSQTPIAKSFILLDPVTHFNREKLRSFFSDFCERHQSRHFPKVSVIGVLYRKAREVGYFLESLSRQSYAGEIEIILVDDLSPDSDVQNVEEYLRLNPNFPHKVIVLRNETNSGNCRSRNRGVQASSGTLVAIIDADCMLNSDFIESHVRTHATSVCEISIGYSNLETGLADPLDALALYESNFERVAQDADLQDRSNRASFVNCITRSVVFQKSLLLKHPLDDEFSFTSNPESGYGWEDVELGTRLYKNGARFQFVPEAFSLHISHQSVADENGKPARSMKNFRRLIERHPELRQLARPWLSETIEKILAWSEAVGAEPGVDGTWLAQELRNLLHYRPRRVPHKRLRILSHRWHCAHQYELQALPHDFTYVQLPVPHFANAWEYEERPLRSNVRFLPLSKIDEREYDLCLLHFDENALAPENADDVLPQNWCEPFCYLSRTIGLPKVAICHGTPQFYGQYDPDYQGTDLGTVIEAAREQLVRFAGEMTIVLNSYQAQAEWQFRRSTVIWHGFDPSEFGPSRYVKQVLTLGDTMKNRPHYRGYEIYRQVSSALPAVQFDGPRVSAPDVMHLSATNAYAESKFLNYREAVRDYSVYFNPTIRSPMPRSRGEAMMSGLIPVSLRNHDVDLFVKNGWNGFFGDSPEELTEALRYLFADPERVRVMGKRARETATDLFHRDRYLARWQELLQNLAS